ncbi:hypothetical protein AAF712_011868 [Marasmius tenuissimus]|uniref:Uncharacterized protein n=1 Tax=Marasmius tenuissimus TaxID=585030 RepID=A0ABR2ZI06_9AGAR
MAGEVWAITRKPSAKFRGMDYPWSGVRVWTSRSILHTFYSPVPLDTNGDPPKERGKDNLSESRINDSSRPSRLYNHQRKPSETHYTPPLFSDASHSEDKAAEGEETEEEQAAGSRSLAILWAQAVVGALRANFRTGIAEWQLKVKTLLTRRQRESRESLELNGHHSSLGEPANNPLAHSPTSDSSGDIPFTPRSAGAPVPDSPSPLSTTNHHPSSFTFPSRSDSPISRPSKRCLQHNNSRIPLRRTLQQSGPRYTPQEPDLRNTSKLSFSTKHTDLYRSGHAPPADTTY